MIDDIPQVFEALFECTLHMINKELEPFPEHRINFFKMLQAISTHCFPGKEGGRCNERVGKVVHCVL